MASGKKSVPEWAHKIQLLRHRLGLSQTSFGSRLHYSAMAVSRWESGSQEPPAQCYIQLGNLAGEPDCWVFWSRAGLKSSDLSRMFPEGRGSLHRTKFPDFELVIAGSGKKRQVQSTTKKVKLVAIPVLAVHAATRGEIGDQQTDLDQIAADEMIAAPSTWCPNPSSTSCLRVKGSSMSPLINDGDVVAVDYSQLDPSELSGKIVVAWHREHGLTLARFLLVRGVQLLDSENREYQPIILEKDRNWRIIGRVLWWIRKAP
jgi:SOS-response transcriptional repressor LexA/DNA-binding XRE family transcriptional regulator